MNTKFKGNPLIEIPKNIPSYNFLKGDFGKEFIKEYNQRVKLDYKDNSNLKILNFKDEVVKGSNLYSIILANDILFQERLRTATPADIQEIIDVNENFLWGAYVDLGLVLRTENSPNEYLAKQLGKQSKERGYNFSNENPLIFRVSDLELILDENSNSGLGFKIKESANPFNAPELNNKNAGKTFQITDENGIPIFDENENKGKYNRMIFTKDEGVSKFNLGRGTGLGARYNRLEFSIIDGRIVVFKDAVKI